MSTSFSRPPIPVIVQQHAEECAALRHVRSVLVRAPHVRLHQLRRLDDRIAAHLDGLVVAGDYGASLCLAQLERPGAGEVFAAAALAFDRRDVGTLDRLLALAAAMPDAKRGLLSACGWVSADLLKGVVVPMLASDDPVRRELGLAACRLHGADPGPALVSALSDADAGVRIAALRTAAALGRLELIDIVREANRDQHREVRRQAAIAATLLGDRGPMLRAVAEAALLDDVGNSAEFALSLQASRFEDARQLVRALATTAPVPGRRLVRACGLLGDTEFVPWLISLMDDDRLARLSGESFSMITGADLAALDLERKPPQRFLGGPNDEPDDTDVALDEDESLPWPEQAMVQRWWRSRTDAMPVARRLFLGQTPSVDAALSVLRDGFQRQRLAAANLHCLLTPGTRRFATEAPAWRQQRRLAASA